MKKLVSILIVVIMSISVVLADTPTILSTSQNIVKPWAHVDSSLLLTFEENEGLSYIVGDGQYIGGKEYVINLIFNDHYFVEAENMAILLDQIELKQPNEHYQLEYNPDKKEFTVRNYNMVTKETKAVVLKPYDSNTTIKPGEYFVDSFAITQYYLPLRYIFEQLGYKVEWNKERKTISIDK